MLSELLKIYIKLCIFSESLNYSLRLVLGHPDYSHQVFILFDFKLIKQLIIRFNNLEILFVNEQF